MIVNRIIIYPKDVQRITGRSERYCRKLIQGIKKELSKKDCQLVTIREFCDYTGIEQEEVEKFLE